MGWYSLQRHRGPEELSVRLGLYCGLECLDEAMDAMMEEEARIPWANENQLPLPLPEFTGPSDEPATNE